MKEEEKIYSRDYKKMGIETRISTNEVEKIDIKNYDTIEYICKITTLSEGEVLKELEKHNVRKLDLTPNKRLYYIPECWDFIIDSLKCRKK